MKGYTESEELKHWWPTKSRTLRYFASRAALGRYMFFFEVAKAADICSTLGNAIY